MNIVYKNGMNLSVLKSIRSQIIFVLVLLITLLLVQSILSSNNQESYANNIKLTQSSAAEINLVGILERDLLDLQRNVLIYKETASSSVIRKFTLLMKKLKQHINELDHPLNLHL